jgi:hypothetical protein
MREEIKTIELDGVPSTVRLLIIEEFDRVKLHGLFNSWKELNEGMREFQSEGIQLPDGLYKSAFCLSYDSARVLEVQGASYSFDTIDLNKWTRQLVKASIVKDDLTVFDSQLGWDELYWLDFYQGGNYDGTFDVYRIPNDVILNVQITKKKTFREQQNQGKSSRLHVRRDIILQNDMKPDRTHYI